MVRRLRTLSHASPVLSRLQNGAAAALVRLEGALPLLALGAPPSPSLAPPSPPPSPSPSLASALSASSRSSAPALSASTQAVRRPWTMADGEQAQGGSASGQPSYDPATDPKRKSKSKDPAWKYCYWPDLNKKDVVKCILCGKVVHAGVRRLKQHLVGGHGDVAKCTKTTSAISKEMQEYLKKNARQKPIDLDDDKEVDKDDEVEVIGQGESGASHSVVQPSSGTALKRRLSVSASQNNQPVSKSSRSIASTLRKAPEDVVRERHCKGNTQTTLPRKSYLSLVQVQPSIEVSKFGSGSAFN